MSPNGHKSPPILTAKQVQFAHEYVIDLNATKATIRAGYSERGASVTGTRLLADPRISTLVSKLMQRRNDRVEVDSAWVLKRLMRVNDRCVDDDTFDSAGANKSAELIGKHLRMFVDRHEVVDVAGAKQYAADVLGIVLRHVQDAATREAIVRDIEALDRV